MGFVAPYGVFGTSWGPLPYSGVPATFWGPWHSMGSLAPYGVFGTSRGPVPHYGVPGTLWGPWHPMGFLELPGDPCHIMGSLVPYGVPGTVWGSPTHWGVLGIPLRALLPAGSSAMGTECRTTHFFPISVSPPPPNPPPGAECGVSLLLIRCSRRSARSSVTLKGAIYEVLIS